MNFEKTQINIGNILLAEPFMEDQNFKRAVVLLCDHDNENGTVGFILNKSTKLKLNDVLDEFPEFGADVFIGGPVQQDTLHFIHNVGPSLDGGIEILDGIYWGGNYDTLKIMIECGEVTPENFKFFLGYSGWTVGQLDEEMTEHSWILTTADQEKVIRDRQQDMWQKILQEMGGKYKIMSNYPEHPSLN